MSLGRFERTDRGYRLVDPERGFVVQVHTTLVGLWGYGVARAGIGMVWSEDYFDTADEAADAAFTAVESLVEE